MTWDQTRFPQNRARTLSTFLFSLSLQAFAGVTVDYITLPGWKQPIVDCRKFEELPANAQKYVNKIQELLGVQGGLNLLFFFHIYKPISDNYTC